MAALRLHTGVLLTLLLYSYCTAVNYYSCTININIDITYYRVLQQCIPGTWYASVLQCYHEGHQIAVALLRWCNIVSCRNGCLPQHSPEAMCGLPQHGFLSPQRSGAAGVEFVAAVISPKAKNVWGPVLSSPKVEIWRGAPVLSSTKANILERGSAFRSPKANVLGHFSILIGCFLFFILSTLCSEFMLLLRHIPDVRVVFFFFL